jgi:hypothetical protein
MGIVYHTNKTTGITYAYENEAYWDKDKKQSRARRKPLGKVDPDTGDIVPTRGYKKKEAGGGDAATRRGPVSVTETKRSFYGATYLFDQIGGITGVAADLKSCFPHTFKQIMSIAYFLILEENNSLCRFPHWQRLHSHPFAGDTEAVVKLAGAVRDIRGM